MQSQPDTSSDAQQTVEKGIRAVSASSAFFKLDVWVIMDVTKYQTLPELLALARCCHRLRRVLVLDDGLWKRRIEIEFPSPLQRQQKDILEIVEAKGFVPPSPPPATVAGISNRTQGPPSPTRTASVAATTAPPYHYEMYKTLFRGYQPSYVSWRVLQVPALPRREGHAQCVLSDGETVFLRFGFLPDSRGYTMRIRIPRSNHTSLIEDPEKRLFAIYGHKLDSITPLRVDQARATHRGSGGKRRSEEEGPAPVLPPPATAATPAAEESNFDPLQPPPHVEELCQYGGCTQGGYSGMVNTFVITQVDLRKCVLKDFVVELPEDSIPPRGYHGQCFDRATGFLYVCGGLLQQGLSNELFRIDVNALRPIAIEAGKCRTPANPATLRAHVKRLPLARLSGRFGLSLGQVGSKLYIAGGYTGSGIFQLFDGIDLTDITEFDTEMEVTRSISTHIPIPHFLGRCHTVCTFGTLLVYFGGTVECSNEITLFDTVSETIRRPKSVWRVRNGKGVKSEPDEQGRRGKGRGDVVDCIGRVAHCASIVRGYLVITGGCNDDQPMFLPQYCDLLEAIRSDPPPQPLTTEELARLGTVRTMPVAQAALLNLSGEPHSPSSDKDQDERANANEEPDSEEEEEHNERPRATSQRVQPELLQRNQLMSFLMNLLGQHTDADDTDPSGDGEAD